MCIPYCCQLPSPSRGTSNYKYGQVILVLHIMRKNSNLTLPITTSYIFCLHPMLSASTHINNIISNKRLASSLHFLTYHLLTDTSNTNIIRGVETSLLTTQGCGRDKIPKQRGMSTCRVLLSRFESSLPCPNFSAQILASSSLQSVGIGSITGAGIKQYGVAIIVGQY